MGRTAFIPGLVGVLVMGCFSDVETPFPPGLEPLEEGMAPAPAPVDGDPYPETVTMVRAFAPYTPRTHAVHARGYVRAPVVDVWAALRDPDVGADRRTFREWSTTYDVEPEYDYSYVIHSVIENVIVVEYDVTWRHGVVLGTLEAPTLASARYQKTAGSAAIDALQGSVVLTEVERFPRDMSAELVIRAHGGELPPISEL